MRVSTLSNKIGFSCFCLLTAEIGVGAGDFFHTLYNDGQCCYSECLRDGIGISTDFQLASHYFKLPADQGNAKGQSQWGMCLLTGKVKQRNLAKAIEYFRMSGDKGTPEGQAVFRWMTENGIGTRMDLIEAVRYDDLCSNQCSDASSLYGRCCQTG
jgi:TPR repeat protein